jgi:hypothetical protein
MFKKTAGPVQVKRRVTIHVPVDGDNTFRKYAMWITYLIEDKSVVDERQANFQSDDPNTDWLPKVIVDWADYMEDDGTTAVPFNEGELKQFLEKNYVRVAIIQEYWNAANGGIGKRKSV